MDSKIVSSALDMILTRKEREKDAIFDNEVARARSAQRGVIHLKEEEEFEKRF